MRTHSQSRAFCDVASLTERQASAHNMWMVARIGHNARPHAHRHFLREWRKHRHLTLVQLALRMAEYLDEEKFSHTQLSRIENGKMRLAEDRVYAAADAMNIEPGWLFVEPETALRRGQYQRHFDGKSEEQITAMLSALEILSKAG